MKNKTQENEKKTIIPKQKKQRSVKKIIFWDKMYVMNEREKEDAVKWQSM